jgi:chitin disaccharide deacetylase
MTAETMKSRSQPLLVIFGITTSIVLIYGIWHTMGSAEKRYLLISADDAGMCSAVNLATAEALQHGVVGSASIMVVCPGFEEFASYAVAHPEYDYGVHLVLTSEDPENRWTPLLGTAVPSLTRMDGSFWRKSEDVAEHALAEEVEPELEAQIYRAIDRGIHISHLDHHMWVLLQRPDLLQIFVRLGLKFRVPLRVHRQFVAEECGKGLENSEEYCRIIQPLVDRGDRLIDFIETSNYVVSPEEKWKYYLDALSKIPPGVSEFVIHCSVSRPGMKLPTAADRREADYLVFTSTQIQSAIRQLGIDVINWKKLDELRR